MKRKLLLLISLLSLTGCVKSDSTQTKEKVNERSREAIIQTDYSKNEEIQEENEIETEESPSITIEEIPVWDGETYARVINENVPFFSEEQLELEKDYFALSDLDELGRAGTAMCVCSKDTVSEDERESLDGFIPSGYQTTQYELIENYNLYNRCHLLMFKACGGQRTDVIENLITGTEYFNTSMLEGMLRYEMELLNYIENTDAHVLYRVTPMYDGDNLVARGVLMEAKAIDADNFEFCVFIYNEEPGYHIDHATGDSYSLEEGEEEITVNKANGEEEIEEPIITGSEKMIYVLNTNTHRFHYEWCDSVNDMKEKNKEVVENKTRDEVIEMGYQPCGNCHP